MTRVLLLLICGSMLAGCSRDGVREVAEGIRIRAEGIGAEAEIRRQDARMAAMDDGGYGTAMVPPRPEAVEPEEAPAPEKKAPPPQPTYVVIPAY